MCMSPVLNRRQVLGGLAALALTLPAARARAAAGAVTVPDPTLDDACPVCGMLPARYPNWIATVLYDDGFAHHFDGAKDMFKYLLDRAKYAPDRVDQPIDTIAVTEYYDLRRINAREALYVTGSDVLGPMGHELIPLATQADATDYTRDHQGRHTLGFQAVTLPLLVGLDEGIFLPGG